MTIYKKILCVSVLAFGLNGISLADDLGESNGSNSGIYLGGQLGMSNMHYGPSSN